MRARAFVIALAYCAYAAPSLVAQTTAESPPPIVFRYSLKGSMLVSRMPDAPLLFPDRSVVTSFWRVRLEPSIRVTDTTSVEIAVEPRARVFTSSAAGIGGGVLPAGAAAPFRVRQLAWQIASSGRAVAVAEVDRAAVHTRAGPATVTIGRQAIGWGRGVAFSAVDLFAPFTPLEADREWRRGVDAIRTEVAISDRVSVDAVAAFGARADRSIVAGRVRGYAGNVDVEVLGGRRATDGFGGISTSAALGGTEIHGELAIYRTPGVAGSVAFAAPRTIVKALAGASYRIPLGTGLLVYGEYHFSGFGASSAAGILPQLADAGFRERYLRGDTQILGRHAVAVLASYEYGPSLSMSGEWLQNPADRSGVLVPSATVTYGDGVSVVFSGYVPYGRPPQDAVLRTEFGAAPLGFFMQIKVYR